MKSIQSLLKPLVPLLAFLFLTASAETAPSAPHKYLVYVGTYTDEGSASKGIYAYRFDQVPLNSRPWAWPRKPSIHRFSPYIPATAFSTRSTRSRTTRAKRAEASAPLRSIAPPAN